MTEIVQGHFEPHRPDLRSYSPTAPFVASQVVCRGQMIEADFLVDTGADSAILSPQDAVSLFGIEEYQELFEHKQLIPVSGVGSGVAVQEVVQLLLFDTVGGLISFNHTITVMGLALDENRRPINWSMPSLLGRDILDHFCLHLCYQPASLELELLDQYDL